MNNIELINWELLSNEYHIDMSDLIIFQEHITTMIMSPDIDLDRIMYEVKEEIKELKNNL